MRPINERFFDRGGMLEVAQRRPVPARAARDPGDLPGLPAARRASRACRRARCARCTTRATLMDAELPPRPGQPRARSWRSCSSRGGITHALRLMNQTSVLGRYLWVFRRIVGQMQHDLFHVYTVDQHILMVLRNVRRFFIPEHAHEYPFCSQLAAQLGQALGAVRGRAVPRRRQGPRRRPLRARRARRRGASAATTASTRDDAQLIEFLVRRAPDDEPHRAEGRPVAIPTSSPPSPSRWATERDLTALYLLTVADIRGTSPKVWNAWKGKLLEDLYRLTLRALGGARAQPRRRDRGAQARGAQPAGAALGAARHRKAAVGHAGRELLRAPRRGRHRLARARRCGAT